MLLKNGDYDTLYLKKYQDIGTLKKLKMCNDGKHPGSGWRFDWVKIDNHGLMVIVKQGTCENSLMQY
jgi:hypothetical protein